VARAFVAVQPPAAVLDAVDALATSAALASLDGARWTTREQRHLTLQFLGNGVDLDAVAVALAALRETAGDAELVGLGAFPRPRRASVLWVGIGDGDELLTRLATAVGRLLAPLGYEPDARPFHAHLTLARFKAPTDVRAVVDAYTTRAVGPRFVVDEVVLYESTLRRTGAQYTARAAIPLGARA
jgi:2'-5' RNA ligase